MRDGGPTLVGIADDGLRIFVTADKGEVFGVDQTGERIELIWFSIRRGCDYSLPRGEHPADRISYIAAPG